MIENLSLLNLIAMLTIVALMIAAVYTWLQFFTLKSRYLNHKGKVQNIRVKLKANSKNAIIYDKAIAQLHSQKFPEKTPWAITLKWVIPRRLEWQDCILHLEETINDFYSSLNQQVEWVKAIAPPTGLLFTVIGLIAVLLEQAQGLNHSEMLGNIGMALITTAFSSLVLIFQETLLSKLEALKRQEYRTGIMLIDMLHHYKAVVKAGGIERNESKEKK